MVSGSIASIEFGEPRATLDIDLVLLLEPSDCETLFHLFDSDSYYIPPLEILRLESSRPCRGHFSIIHVPSGLKADCYPSRNHPYLDWALANRRRRQLQNTGVWFAPPEYVILWKLEFHQESGEQKHLRDIRGMIAVSGDEIDLGFLETAVSSLGLAPQWQQCIR